MTNMGKVVVFAVLLFSLVSTCFVYAASAASTTVTAEANSTQLKVGDTLTVNIKVSGTSDLYGLDVTLNWNTAVLKEISATNNLGVESHPDGVLHESASYPIDVEDETVTDGQYHLLATSQGASTASFSGSGTIATVVFNLTGTGNTGLSLDAELSLRNSAGEISLNEPITSVSAVSIAVPEFPTIAVVAVVAVAVAGSVIVVVKLHKPKAAALASSFSKI
jgi:hypothetical protein